MSVTIHRVHHPMVGLLGRIVVPDPQDAAYSLRTIQMPGPPRKVPGKIGPTLDQNPTPECVAFTGRNWLNAEPISDPDQATPDPATIYAWAQANDGIFGQHDGSNSRGLMKGFQAHGLVDAYHWATKYQDAIDYVLTTGPVMFGVNWRQGMFSPDANGICHNVGPVEGGHEFLGYWYDLDTKMWRLQQTWGDGWGIHDARVQTDPNSRGTFCVLDADMRSLLAEGGDCCAAQLNLKKLAEMQAQLRGV